MSDTFGSSSTTCSPSTITETALTSLLEHPCLFVIQEHAATRHHWDLRLRVHSRTNTPTDVLRSWAVPKGPSFNPTEKRLAQETTDHDIGYAGFEGVIPRESYGAGTTMVWDIGTYCVPRKKGEEKDTTSEEEGGRKEQERLERGLAKGHARIRFFGQKMRGDFVLFRMMGTRVTGGSKRLRALTTMSPSPSGKSPPTVTPRGTGAWLLIKKKDGYAIQGGLPDITLTAPLSVLTGRTMFQIGCDAGAEVDNMGHWIKLPRVKRERRAVSTRVKRLKQEEGKVEIKWTDIKEENEDRNTNGSKCNGSILDVTDRSDIKREFPYAIKVEDKPALIRQEHAKTKRQFPVLATSLKRRYSSPILVDSDSDATVIDG
ncbi:DNA ligase D, 3'-phosphoesterase domain-containing protein [Spizellomyces punctatus DAOM BR117]|uniref:DNA ligase D, 3'-phosphoesterase domain-containing protein n=1 Tax=Spizellomyces punctatus (strain DAOM BR117) TaxID=645134 RepID=A0A0L0HKC7_SPIPD|nr:DNA ligase D, 3'-phosphoesterase domain-containing protein [Spizellomyces punctatus DAOM BR117]KND01279.1 DNA ligase D, 3'-phosphoesterase domain-containing protein [Spizellomyces punctatus DAOM BR117]|eukprot:XP_016609318.1 DNA ligase D, 3'-phosphoesterase domain-containing protein [Spizellomyces punctatus DAOM BR117]